MEFVLFCLVVLCIFLLYLNLLNLQITIFTSKEICLLSVVEYKEYFMVKSDDDVMTVLLPVSYWSVHFLFATVRPFVSLSSNLQQEHSNTKLKGIVS